jgi:HD-GYP domain-containing protein (c-di-GMP phosphodiesterase class II)
MNYLSSCVLTDQGVPIDGADVWDHLDHFLLQLQQAEDVSRQLKATLDMVRRTTHAGVVFLYSGAARGVTHSSSKDSVDPGALKDLTRVLLAHDDEKENHVLHSSLESWGMGRFSSSTIDRAEKERGPSSAALVRMSRSREAWIVALRFGNAPPLTMRDVKLMCLARRLLRQQQQQQQAHGELRDMLFSLVRCLTASLDARDPYTWGHSERVARIAVRLGEQMRLTESARSELYLGGLLHDVGKIGVPDETLRKPGALTPDEMALVQQHVLIGDAIVAHVRQLAHLRPLVRSHHERWDGRGYPDRLSGECIPFPARILAVADSCDAMMSDRPYRKALPREQITDILADGAGKQWDPAVIAAFLPCKDEVFAMSQRGMGDSAMRAVEHALDGAEHGAGAVRSFLGLRPSTPGRKIPQLQ